MSDDRKRTRGRPRGPCSPRERAERQGAALKHGGRATTALRQALPGCKRASCPDGVEYPCEVKQGIEGLGVCLPTLAVDEDVRTRFVAALAGDPSRLDDLVATALTSQHELYVREGAKLLRDGFGLDQVLMVRGEDGELLTDEDGQPYARRVLNPAVMPFLRLSQLLGYSAEAQGLTRTAKAQARRDESLGSLAEEMARLQRALGEGGP